MKHIGLILNFGLAIFLLLSPTIILSQTNFWQATSSLGSGSICALAVNSKGDVFASNGFVYRSTDNGNSWTQLTLPTWPYGITALMAAPNGKVFGGAYGAIFMSTDNGDTWYKKANIYNSSTSQNYDVTSFVVRPDSIVFAGTLGGGLYYSEKGFQWYPPGVNGGSFMIEAMALDSKGYLLTGDYNGAVGRSLNGSGGWTWASHSLYRAVVALVTVPPSSVFAATREGVFRSTDDGGSFAEADTGLTRRIVKYMVANSQGVLFAGTDSAGVFRSTDHGSSWTQINTGLTDKLIGAVYNSHQVLAVSPDGYLFAGTQSGVVFRSVKSTVTSVREAGSIGPRRFFIQQNYPNPFNPMTAIRYSVPFRSFIRLAVFNTIGEKCQTLVSGDQEPGEYEIRFDGSRLPSGIYFYRISAGAYTETRKMVLMK